MGRTAVVSARGGGSIQVAAGDLIPVCPSVPVTQGAFHVQQEKNNSFVFFTVRTIWCVSEICFRLRWVMGLIINYIAHFEASPLPAYQVRCGKSHPSGPTILLFRNYLYIHPFPFSDTRLLPHFHLSQEFTHNDSGINILRVCWFLCLLLNL